MSEAQRAKVNAYNRKYANDHPDYRLRRAKHSRDWKIKNQARFKECQRMWRLKNPDKRLLSSRREYPTLCGRFQALVDAGLADSLFAIKQSNFASRKLTTIEIMRLVVSAAREAGLV